MRLAEKFGPIGIEASGYTLEEIAARDAAWIEKAHQLLAAGRIELIGSAYAQMIGPLVPRRVTEANLVFGHEIYERLLAVKPAVAVVNEYVYSRAIVGLYLNAGYRALAMDWDNPGMAHTHWALATRPLVELP